MPSPVGHALGGLAAGWLICPPGDRQVPPRAWRPVLVLAFAGCAADLDLLVGVHRSVTHSVGATLIAGLAGLALTRNARWGAAIAAAWGSHVLLDWLGTDTRPPIGIMALWPLTQGYYESSLHVFSAVSRRYWLPEFIVWNARSVLRELLVLGPVAAAIVIWDARRRRALRADS